MQGNSNVRSMERYKPVTSDKETTQIGLSNLNYASSNVQRDNQVIQNQINTVVDQATRQIPNALLSLFQTRENAIQENFVFQKTIADNEKQAEINSVSTNESISANQRAAMMKILAVNWKNQSNLMVDNLEKNNNFVLRKSNLAVGELKNQNEKFFNELENKIAVAAQKNNLEEYTENITNRVNYISTLSDENEINNTSQFLSQTIKNSPLFSNAKKLDLLEKVSTGSALAAFNTRKEKIINLNTDDNIDNSKKALSLVEQEINLFDQKSQNGFYAHLPNLLNRSKHKIELENLRNNIRKNIKSESGKNLINNIPIDLNISDVEYSLKIRNSPEFKKALKENDTEFINNVLSTEKQVLKEKADNPIASVLRNQPNLTATQRQEALNAVGLNKKTILVEHEKAIFVNTVNEVGTFDKKDNNSNFISTEQQLKDAINYSRQFFGGNNNLIIKEAMLNLNPMQAIAIKAELENNPNKVQLLDFMVQENKTGKRPNLYSTAQMESKKSNFFTDRGYGQFMVYTQPEVAIKMAQAAIDAEQYSGNDKRGGKLKVKDFGKILNPNNNYIISGDRTRLLEIDKTKYNANVIEKQVMKVQRDISKYASLSNLPLKDQELLINLSDAEKMRLRGGTFTNNISAQTNNKNEVEFFISGQKAGREKVRILRIPLDSLPVLGNGEDKSLNKVFFE